MNAADIERVAVLAETLKELQDTHRRLGEDPDPDALPRALFLLHRELGEWMDVQGVARMLHSGIGILLYSLERGELPGPAIKTMIKVIKNWLPRLPLEEQRMLGVDDPWTPPVPRTPPPAPRPLNRRVPGKALAELRQTTGEIVTKPKEWSLAQGYPSTDVLERAIAGLRKVGQAS